MPAKPSNPNNSKAAGGDNELTPQQAVKEAERKMDSAIQALNRDLASIRTGRASPALVENVTVDYYGTPTPLNQLATITAPDARAIMVQPWDKAAIKEIEKSLQKSEMGFNPSNDGATVTVPVPPLTQERRQDMVKMLKRKAEEGKIAIRNVRRDGVDHIRRLEKDKAISQDESRRAQEQLQKSTDSHIKTVDQVAASKEAEILQV